MPLSERPPAEILLVEDTLTDAKLIAEAFERGPIVSHLSIVENGVEAMRFLRGLGKYAGVPRANLILLDLNMPLKDGYEVLAEIKADEDLKSIPVIVLTSSPAESDVARAYDLKANCYIPKPGGFDELRQLVVEIESFWFSTATLPPRPPPV